VVLFARHVRAEDPLHEVPPDGLFPYCPRQFTPHVYEPGEIESILTEAGRLGPAGSLRPYIFSALFSLLFATGLRISEALALRFEDITSDGLIVRRTKFRKTRLVPLHDTAQKGLERFLDRRRTTGAMSDHIFIDLDGMPLRYRGVRTAFDQIRGRAGLARPAGQPQPRIHDTRHTFAVRALESSPDGRDRIGEHMLALATYLGHSRIADTYWYLQATPRLMLDIADACGALLDGGNP
jgi:integrase